MPPTVPLYWRAAPGAVGRGLLVGGLVHDQHRVRPRPGLRSGAPAAQSAAASSICRSSQRARDSRCCIRYGLRVPGGLGQRPAVVVLKLGQQAVHHVTAGQPGLPAGEARRDPRHQVIEQARVRVMVYAGSSGCRVIVLFHKLA